MKEIKEDNGGKLEPNILKKIIEIRYFILNSL